MKNSKGPQTQPTVNYVRGRIIDILFEDRRVATVTVTKGDGRVDRARGGGAPTSGRAPATTPSSRRRPAVKAAGHSTMMDGNKLPESVRALLAGASQTRPPRWIRARRDSPRGG